MNHALVSAYVYSHIHGGVREFDRRIHLMILASMTADELKKAQELIQINASNA